MVRTTSSQIRARPGRLTPLMMIPHTARTVSRPVHAQESPSTVSGEAAPGARARIVSLNPARYVPPPISRPASRSTISTTRRIATRLPATLPPGFGNAVSSTTRTTIGSNRTDE